MNLDQFPPVILATFFLESPRPDLVRFVADIGVKEIPIGMADTDRPFGKGNRLQRRRLAAVGQIDGSLDNRGMREVAQDATAARALSRPGTVS